MHQHGPESNGGIPWEWQREIGTDTQRGEAHVNMEAESGVMSHNPRDATIVSNHRSQGALPGRAGPQTLPRERGPADISVFTSSLQSCERVTFRCF